MYKYIHNYGSYFIVEELGFYFFNAHLIQRPYK